MIQCTCNESYDDFKTDFTSLGGNKKTTVVLSAAGGAFTLFALFPADNIVLVIHPASRPSSFDTDFPNAVAMVGGVSIS